MKSILALSTLALTSAFGFASEDQVTYVHGFRSPLIGAEIRQKQVGYYAGYYSTIFNGDDSKATNFWKAGTTYYFGNGPTAKQEVFVSLAYMYGINRDFKNKDGIFFEVGNRISLGKQFEVRLGTGLLFADGFKTRVNPTIGISYRF